MKNKQIKTIAALVVCAVVLFVSWLNTDHGQNQESQISSEISTSGSVSDASIEESPVEINYTFRDQELFDSHYKDHGTQFGDITQEEYLILANKLLESSTALRKEEKVDGDYVIYEESENQFLILSKDGYIRTFFKPDEGIEYYKKQ